MFPISPAIRIQKRDYAFFCALIHQARLVLVPQLHPPHQFRSLELRIFFVSPSKFGRRVSEQLCAPAGDSSCTGFSGYKRWLRGLCLSSIRSGDPRVRSQAPLHRRRSSKEKVLLKVAQNWSKALSAKLELDSEDLGSEELHYRRYLQ